MKSREWVNKLEADAKADRNTLLSVANFDAAEVAELLKAGMACARKLREDYGGGSPELEEWNRVNEIYADGYHNQDRCDW